MILPPSKLISRLKMYYEPHASRDNLVVLTSVHVTRILLSKVVSGEVTAESICFLHDGNEYRAFVKNEVIVSAGYTSLIYLVIWPRR